MLLLKPNSHTHSSTTHNTTHSTKRGQLDGYGYGQQQHPHQHSHKLASRYPLSVTSDDILSFLPSRQHLISALHPAHAILTQLVSRTSTFRHETSAPLFLFRTTRFTPPITIRARPQGFIPLRTIAIDSISIAALTFSCRERRPWLISLHFIPHPIHGAAVRAICPTHPSQRLNRATTPEPALGAPLLSSSGNQPTSVCSFLESYLPSSSSTASRSSAVRISTSPLGIDRRSGSTRLVFRTRSTKHLTLIVTPHASALASNNGAIRHLRDSVA